MITSNTGNIQMRTVDNANRGHMPYCIKGINQLPSAANGEANNTEINVVEKVIIRALNTIFFIYMYQK